MSILHSGCTFQQGTCRYKFQLTSYSVTLGMCTHASRHAEQERSKGAGLKTHPPHKIRLDFGGKARSRIQYFFHNSAILAIGSVHVLRARDQTGRSFSSRGARTSALSGVPRPECSPHCREVHTIHRYWPASVYPNHMAAHPKSYALCLGPVRCPAGPRSHLLVHSRNREATILMPPHSSCCRACRK